MEGEKRPSSISAGDFQRLLLMPDQSRLEESFRSELSEYAQLDASMVSTRMEQSAKRMAAEWQSRDRSTEQSQKDFYLNNEEYFFNLCKYNSSEQFAQLGVAAVNLALSTANTRTVIDFGCGIGSLSIVFSRLGFRVVLADISKPLLDFARWRFEKRFLEASFVNLELETPGQSAADLVVALDTFEHIGNPRSALERIYEWLNKEGVVVFNTFSPKQIEQDPEHPMHISSGRKIIPEMRSIGFGRRSIFQGLACYQKPSRQLVPKWASGLASRAYWSIRWKVKDLVS